ncbi:ATP-binding protein [Brasilonema octagenarum UFV-E1]|uniref:ATP-binding protein n=1 Tax=Brasilonema sennae CENA114 TaxID=415709 RepID=A0A856MLL3_9CYAN|nr:AAA family ATPase [Brasilonema sennae]QDL11578.1 ATP-binding protein [Brasilonema sennae CENA114]QDL17956.1 ATP-binding protein [Brasilonema octagenarum UFV-E1]
MKVKRIKINSFRGIGDLTLDLPETEPAVLIGINGVGKSSILDCIAILLSQFTGQIQHGHSTRSLSEQDITNESPKMEISIIISPQPKEEITWSLSEERKEGKSVKSAGEVRLEAIKSLIDGISQQRIEKLGYGDEVTNALQAASIVLSQIKADEVSQDPLKDLQTLVDDINNQLVNNDNASIPLAVYYPVNRAVLDMPLEISEEHLFTQRNAYDQALTGGRIDFKSFFEWFRNREDLENELRRDNPNHRDKQLEAIRGAVSSLQPDFSDLRVERSPLRMTIKKQGQELIVNQLSDGEKCLLAMVGDLARRLAIANPSLDNPLEGEGIVLIDEIELHLHPKWQRQVITALIRTFPNCQFIITTHSPQVVSHVKPNSIYLLQATPDGIVAERPENSFGRDSNQILEDLMGVSERPQEIKENLQNLFRLIDQGHLDRAKQLRQNLADEIGEDDPEFVRADVLIRRKEILNR